jgi:hypothetical protein
MGYHQKVGIFDGICKRPKPKYHQLEGRMALTDTFVGQVKHSGAPAGDKHADGLALYLLVKVSGKYWCMHYRFGGKQKTLALGVYPAVSLAKARKRREAARELLADGIDPSQAKNSGKQIKASEAANTFEVVARTWLTKTAAMRADSTQEKITAWIEKDLLPPLGKCQSPA